MSDEGRVQKEAGGFFAILADAMQLLPPEEGQKDLQMVEYETVSLKRSRSPPTSSSPSSLKTTSATSDQVSSHNPSVYANEKGKLGVLDTGIVPSITGLTEGRKREGKKEWRRVGGRSEVDREVIGLETGMMEGQGSLSERVERRVIYGAGVERGEISGAGVEGKQGRLLGEAPQVSMGEGCSGEVGKEGGGQLSGCAGSLAAKRGSGEGDGSSGSSGEVPVEGEGAKVGEGKVETFLASTGQPYIQPMVSAAGVSLKTRGVSGV